MFAHRWQIDALIDTLGPFAEGFGLDEWLLHLDKQQTGVVLPGERWAWMQQQLAIEIARRDLMATRHWTARCPHTPICSNATNCQTLSVIEEARRVRGS